MGAARCYVAMGRGIVHVKNGSANEVELTQGEGISVAKYNNPSEIADNMKNNTVNTECNQSIMKERYDSKYKVLKSIYK